VRDRIQMMKKPLIILLVLLTVVAISGCTTKQATNGTFGERTVSTSAITVSGNTTTEYRENYDNNGTTYYLIQGYVQNNNPYEAFNVKLQATVYDENNKTINQTNNVYILPKNMPSQSLSYFSVAFKDKNKLISRYEIKVISADAYA
jgi:hypothetical protein